MNKYKMDTFKEATSNRNKLNFKRDAILRANLGNNSSVQSSLQMGMKSHRQSPFRIQDQLTQRDDNNRELSSNANSYNHL